MKNSAELMPLGLFRKIVKKAKSENYDIIGLYNWSEPFLVGNLPEYIKIVKEFEFPCQISSNLSLKGRIDIIEKSLSLGIDRLIVSVSGFDQEIYAINHRGGNIESVKKNLEYISKFKNQVRLRFIKFDYNIKEEPKLQEYAKSLGIDFEVIPGLLHPSVPISDINGSEQAFIDRLRNTPEIREGLCPLTMESISINYKGDVYLCCAMPNYSIFKIGPYLKMNSKEILFKKYFHMMCRSCPWERTIITDEYRKLLSDALLLPVQKNLIQRAIKCYKDNGLIYTINKSIEYSLRALS